MAPMAYRGSYLCIGALNLLFMVPRAPSWAASPGPRLSPRDPALSSYCLQFCCAPPPPHPSSMWNLGKLAFSALDFILMIKCLCHGSLLPNSKQY